MQTLPFVNTQTPEKPDHREDDSLDVVSVFKTIQGEGPHAGAPAIFVRLAGCNLHCSLCDTDYTTGRQRRSVEQLVDMVRERKGTDNIQWVVLTGGEPLRQNVGLFVERLIEWLDVEVETNGTYTIPELSLFDSIICSPKTSKVNEDLERYTARMKVLTFKYVVESGQTDPDDGLPLSILGTPCRVARPRYNHTPIFIQPQDDQDPEKNKANVEEAVRVCMKFGYRLSIQTHKIIGLP